MAGPCLHKEQCPELKEATEKLQTMTKLMNHFRDRLMDETNLRKAETKLKETAQQELLSDPLTGAWNRRALIEYFQKECSRNERFKRNLFMLFMDIDKFKRFNAEHGELTGDLVLAQVVGTIKGNLRGYDSIYRWGGEEFLVLLPEIVSLRMACQTAERIRKKVAALRVTPYEGGDALSVTISIGVARFMDGDSLDSLIHNANLAEIEAKNNGRNRTYVYSDEEIVPVQKLLRKAK